MTFLTPWSALLAAAIAIPLLLLLYILRLRRQRLRVASTLLWEKSFEDLQANVPFQRLRWSLLLLLQLLLLILLLLALAQPMARGEGVAASRVVLLIDRTASMNTLVPDEVVAGQPATRFDLATARARTLINNLGRGGSESTATQMMIITFAGSPQVVTPFESNRRALLEALDSITPTDEQADLDAALQLAGAYAGGTDEREEPPDVLLLSDGRVHGEGDTAGYRLRAGNFQFIQVVPETQLAEHQTNNLGIAAFSARREHDDPARVLVFARLVNAGAQPVDAVLTLWADDQVVTSVRRTIPAATDAGPGEQPFTHALELLEGAVLTLRHNHDDALPADDVAWQVLPSPARPRIALVHPANTPVDPFLHDLLEALEPQRLDVLSDAAFANLDARQLDAGALYELIVFDRVSASRLPGVPSVTFGGVPAAVAGESDQVSEEPAPRAGRPILSWDRQHPLMRNVSLDTIIFAGFDAYQLPAGATALAFGPDGPVIALLRARGAQHVLVGFELIRSNWPLHVSSAIFMQNVLDHLTLARLGQNGVVFRPGEPISVRAQPDATELVIEGPTTARLTVEPGSMVTLPSLRRAGLYRVQGAAPPFDLIAVSMLSDVESDVRPNSTLIVNAEQAQAWRGTTAAVRPLWPWIIGLALTLLIIEWLVYCRKNA